MQVIKMDANLFENVRRKLHSTNSANAWEVAGLLSAYQEAAARARKYECTKLADSFERTAWEIFELRALPILQGVYGAYLAVTEDEGAVIAFPNEKEE